MLPHRKPRGKGMRTEGDAVPINGVKIGAACHGVSSREVAGVSRDGSYLVWSLGSCDFLNQVLSAKRGAVQRGAAQGAGTRHEPVTSPINGVHCRSDRGLLSVGWGFRPGQAPVGSSH